MTSVLSLYDLESNQMGYGEDYGNSSGHAADPAAGAVPALFGITNKGAAIFIPVQNVSGAAFHTGSAGNATFSVEFGWHDGTPFIYAVRRSQGKQESIQSIQNTLGFPLIFCTARTLFSEGSGSG